MLKAVTLISGFICTEMFLPNCPLLLSICEKYIFWYKITSEEGKLKCCSRFLSQFVVLMCWKQVDLVVNLTLFGSGT